MIDAHLYSPEDVKRIYSRRSRIYSKTVAPLEFPNHLKAIASAKIKPHEKVLEVAVGPGLALVEIAKYVDPSQTIYGVDIAPGMLEIAQENLNSAGIANIELAEGTAAHLQFPDETFDVLYNAYMLDLIPLAEMDTILKEFYRVLKPGGRMILLNMSKASEQEKTLRERLYHLFPAKLVLYLAGGCRPVLMKDAVLQVGFRNIQREFIPGKFPSEIVTATR